MREAESGSLVSGQIAKEGCAMNDIQSLEHELIGLARERRIAVGRGDTAKAGFIDDVIANRRWWLQRLKAEQNVSAEENGRGSSL